MSDDTLYRLGADASILVTERLMSEDFNHPDRKIEDYRTDTGLTANLSQLEQVIDWVMDDQSKPELGDTSINAAVAPAVRRCIDIPLREAGDSGIWHYLAICWRPDFVRFRWPFDAPNRTTTSMTEKFLGSTQDLYTNAFSRLWFMAEFSCQGDDYSETEKLLNSQYRANRLFDRKDLRRPRTGRVLTRIANEASDDAVVERTAKAVSHRWSVTAEECLGDVPLKHLIEEIYERKSR